MTYEQIASDLAATGCGCDTFCSDDLDACPNWNGERCTFARDMIAKALAEAERKGRMEGLEIAAPVIEAVRLFFANWRERQGGLLALRERLKEFDARLSELEKGEGR